LSNDGWDDTTDPDFLKDESLVVLVYEPDGQTAVAVLREEAIAVATPNGEVYTFGVDPTTGGLLVVVEGTIAVGLIPRADGKVRTDSLVLIGRGQKVPLHLVN
jgi:hypothetical protein